MKYSRNKKGKFVLILSLLLVVLSVTVFANSREIVTGVSDKRSLNDTVGLGQSGNYYFARPGEEVRIPITADMFVWNSGRVPLKKEAMLLRELRNSKVTVRTLKQAGAKALDYVQFDEGVFSGQPFFISKTTIPTGKTAYISIMFAEELVDVNEIEFELEVYMAIGGETSESLRISIAGILANNEMDAGIGTDRVNTSDATVVHARDHLDRVTVEAGAGVEISHRMVAGRKYYATAVVKPASDPGFEEDYPDIYPSVVAAYKLSTVNMRFGGPSRVRIKEEEKVYHVYDEYMQYLGTTEDELSYSDIYFLSTEIIPSFGDEYVEGLSTNPLSMRNKNGLNAQLDIDEGELLRKQQQEDDRILEVLHQHQVELNRNNKKTGSSGERIDSSPNIAYLQPPAAERKDTVEAVDTKMVVVKSANEDKPIDEVRIIEVRKASDVVPKSTSGGEIDGDVNLTLDK